MGEPTQRRKAEVSEPMQHSDSKVSMTQVHKCKATATDQIPTTSSSLIPVPLSCYGRQALTSGNTLFGDKGDRQPADRRGAARVLWLEQSSSGVCAFLDPSSEDHEPTSWRHVCRTPRYRLVLEKEALRFAQVQLCVGQSRRRDALPSLMSYVATRSDDREGARNSVQAGKHRVNLDHQILCSI